MTNAQTACDTSNLSFLISLSVAAAVLCSLGCATQGNGNMPAPRISVAVDVNSVKNQADSVLIRYTVTNKSDAPIYLVDGPRMPYLRRSQDQGESLEVWAGVPPKQSAGPQLTGIFELPKSLELAAGAAKTLDVTLNKPLKTTDHFSSASAPLDARSETVKARLIVGYGTSPISPVQIDRADKLLQWQSTVTSAAFELPVR